MDVLCPVCGEPWDHDELHELAAELEVSYTEAARLFRTEGCAAFPGNKHSAAGDTFAAEAARVTYDLLGDDMDGAASMFEDML